MNRKIIKSLFWTTTILTILSLVNNYISFSSTKDGDIGIIVYGLKIILGDYISNIFKLLFSFWFIWLIVATSLYFKKDVIK